MFQVESLEGDLSREKEEAWVRGVAADQEAERLSALLEEARRAGARVEQEVVDLRARYVDRSQNHEPCTVGSSGLWGSSRP